MSYNFLKKKSRQFGTLLKLMDLFAVLNELVLFSGVAARSCYVPQLALDFIRLGIKTFGIHCVNCMSGIFFLARDCLISSVANLVFKTKNEKRKRWLSNISPIFRRNHKQKKKDTMLKLSSQSEQAQLTKCHWQLMCWRLLGVQLPPNLHWNLSWKTTSLLVLLHQTHTFQHCDHAIAVGRPPL